MKIAWLPCIFIRRFIVSLEVVINYIWHIIITGAAHEYTHNVDINLLTEKTSLSTVVVYWSLDKENI